MNALNENDMTIIDESKDILEMFNLSPEHLLMDIIKEMEDRQIRKRILKYIITSGHLPEISLLKMLTSDKWYVVRNAVTMIMGIADPQMIPLLEKTLSHPEEKVRKETMMALAQIKGKEALNLLFRIYNDRSQLMRFRALAVDCMGKFNEPRVQKLCLEIVNTEKNPIQEFEIITACLRQLGHYKDTKTIKILLIFIKKPRLFHRKAWDELKETAFEALEQIGTLEAKGALLQAEKYRHRK
jgi:HEAT repeat protein